MNDAFVRLLRYSERYTKTDMVYLVKNSGWLLLGQLVTSFAAFAAMIIVANLADQGDYGEYRFLVSMLILMSVFTLPGMNIALTQSIATGHDGQLTEVVTTRWRYGLLASILSLVFALYYLLQPNSALALSFLVIAFGVPFFSVFQSYFYYLQGKQQFSLAARLQMFSQPALALCIAVTAFFFPNSLWLISVYLFSTILFQWICYRYTLRLTPRDTHHDSELLSYGKYLTLYNTFPTTLAAQAGTVVVWYFLGDIEAAIYSVAIMIPNEVSRSGIILGQIALPRITLQKKDFSKFIAKFCKLEILLIIIFIFYSLIASLVFEVFFPKYADTFFYSIVAMVSILFGGRYVLRSYINAHKLKLGIAFTSVFISIIQLVLVILLTYKFGILGAIVAPQIGWFLEIILLIFIIYKHAKE